MKKKLLVLGLVLLGASIFAGVIAKSGWQEIAQILSQLTLGKLFAFLAFIQISNALFTWRWQIILRTHGHHVRFWDLWWYRATGYGVTYITPTPVGGEPARIYFLNENHGIPLRESTASVFLDKLLELSTFVVFIAAGVIVVSFSNILPQNSEYAALAFMTLFVGFFTYVFKKLYDNSGFFTTTFQRLGLKRIKRLHRLEEKIYRTERLMMDFLSHTEHRKSTLPFLVLLSCAGWLLTIAEYALIASFLGAHLSLYQSFIISTVPSIAYLLPVPGGFGLLEGLQAGVFSVFGFSTAMALGVAVMVRVKEFFFCLLGFGYAITHGLTLLGKKSEKEPPTFIRRLQKPRSFRSPEQGQTDADHQRKEQHNGHQLAEALQGQRGDPEA